MALHLYLGGETEKRRNESVKIACSLIRIRREYLQTTSIGRYRFTNFPYKALKLEEYM